MKRLRVLLALIFFAAWQNGSSQVIVSEEIKNKICYQAFGGELTEESVFADGTTCQVSLFPSNMVTILSLISGRIWEPDHLLETLPFDMLRISAVSDWSDQIFLILGTEIIHFDIYDEYPKVLKRLLHILKKHKVDESLLPLFCARFSTAYLWGRYNHRDHPMSESEKEYKKYW